ncbi:site-2 protease family protein [Algisphaera agarilytica]|uniref:Zn-dependent protease n=1 Tax=Algisphaera agarilytica TaxID=1385975 RepID=A0A7X0H915_9BACT|nr:site-2 protease family protein [Algisphaera agarilytica]MBB6431517.1 Zn-dependent protease [Algisphaera agarilytica]
MLSPQGSFRLFGFRGIDVFVHWSWFIAAYILFSYTGGQSTGDLMSFMLIYGSLFGIIVLHEFGHALACRSVGGEAKHIVLWPLGGVAFVNPPARPGAVLWSIAAGPLVNVVLVPVFFGLYMFSGGFPDWLQSYLLIMGSINTALLVFNMLPIYPLDGGQILQSILWFFMGRAKSLRVTASIGLVIGGFAFLTALLGVSKFIPLLQQISQIMLLLLSAFVVWQAWNGFRVARYLALQEAYEKDGLEKALQRAREMTAGPGRNQP